MVWKLSLGFMQLRTGLAPLNSLWYATVYETITSIFQQSFGLATNFVKYANNLVVGTGQKLVRGLRGGRRQGIQTMRPPA